MQTTDAQPTVQPAAVAVEGAERPAWTVDFCRDYDRADPCNHRLALGLGLDYPTIGGERYALPLRVRADDNFAPARDGQPFLCGRHAAQQWARQGHRA